MLKENEKFENKIDGLIEEEQIKIDKFLSDINSTIVEIRRSEDKKYSLLSSIFNCFYENKLLSIPKQAVFDYIHQDVIKYKGKMIVSFVLNGTNSMEIINENNYIKKTNSILSRNKCLIMEENQISIDINFIQIHKNLMYRNLFGREGRFFNLAHKKIKKLKSLKINQDQHQSSAKKSNSQDNPRDQNNHNDDYEIEIVDSDFDSSKSRQSNKQNKKLSNDFNPKSDSNSTNFTSLSKISDLEKAHDRIDKIITITPTKKDKNIYLAKKRKIKRISKNKDQYNRIINNIINTENKNNKNKNGEDKSDEISVLNLIEDDNNNKEKKEEIKAEKEILSLIEEGKLFLSLFKDKELLNEIESQKNTSTGNNNNDNDNDAYIKSILLNYCNDNNIKNNLNVLNEDYTLFQNSLKKLIDYKSTFNNANSTTFFSKFSIMNKIIVGKEKCNLLIDKIIMKLKQLILEYSFIRKAVNNFDNNKTDFYMKLKGVMTDNKKQEKDNYVNDLKMQLKDELNKALLNNKEQNDK